MGLFNRLAQKIAVAPILFYRYAISPVLSPRCRFFPSCSKYALLSVRLHGVVKGGWMAFKRVMRCHPFSEGGVDEVPAVHRSGLLLASCIVMRAPIYPDWVAVNDEIMVE